MSEEDACYKIAHDEFPDDCGKCDARHCNMAIPEYHFHCGCTACTDSVWFRDAEGITCGKRIDWLQTFDGGEMSLMKACKKIAEKEYPKICGACNPNSCEDYDDDEDSGIISLSSRRFWVLFSIGFTTLYSFGA